MSTLPGGSWNGTTRPSCGVAPSGLWSLELRESRTLNSIDLRKLVVMFWKMIETTTWLPSWRLPWMSYTYVREFMSNKHSLNMDNFHSFCITAHKVVKNRNFTCISLSSNRSNWTHTENSSLLVMTLPDQYPVLSLEDTFGRWLTWKVQLSKRQCSTLNYSLSLHSLFFLSFGFMRAFQCQLKQFLEMFPPLLWLLMTSHSKIFTIHLFIMHLSNLSLLHCHGLYVCVLCTEIYWDFIVDIIVYYCYYYNELSWLQSTLEYVSGAVWWISVLCSRARVFTALMCTTVARFAQLCSQLI